MDWIDLAQDWDQWKAVMNTEMNPLLPQNVEKFMSSCATGGFTRRTQLHAFSYLVMQFVRTVYGDVIP
jgi:hypothetical protein